MEQQRGSCGGSWPARDKEVEREDDPIEERREGEDDADNDAPIVVQSDGGDWE